MSSGAAPITGVSHPRTRRARGRMLATTPTDSGTPLASDDTGLMAEVEPSEAAQLTPILARTLYAPER